MIKQNVKWTSSLILVLFCMTSFIGFSKALHHSLDSIGNLLHFHMDSQHADHHNKNSDHHTDEEAESTVFIGNHLVKESSIQIIIIPSLYSEVSDINLKYATYSHYANSSGSDPPIKSSLTSLFYPNALPSLV